MNENILMNSIGMSWNIFSIFVNTYNEKLTYWTFKTGTLLRNQTDDSVWLTLLAEPICTIEAYLQCHHDACYLSRKILHAANAKPVWRAGYIGETLCNIKCGVKM